MYTYTYLHICISFFCIHVNLCMYMFVCVLTKKPTYLSLAPQGPTIKDNGPFRAYYLATWGAGVYM